MPKHVMVDLETMGTGRKSLILSIGAVEFDPNFRGTVAEQDAAMKDANKFYVAIDPVDAERWNLKISASTFMWWLKPEQAAARERLLSEDKVGLYDALTGFADWLGPDAVVWGNGVLMDNALLLDACEACGLDRPWTYKGDADYRTIRRMQGAIPNREYGTLHHALDDAVAQALTMQDILETRNVVIA